MSALAASSAGAQYSEFWDPRSKQDILRVLPGGYCVTQGAQVITTVLGSCVAACIRDPKARVGGMNHFMLPEAPDDNHESWGGLSGTEARYGDYAMTCLINELMQRGASRENMQVKVFGGGDVMGAEKEGAALRKAVGTRNVTFVKRFLATEGFEILSEDVGGRVSRTIRYLPMSGQVWVKQMDHRDSSEENEYRKRLRLEQRAKAEDESDSDIEFF